MKTIKLSYDIKREDTGILIECFDNKRRPVFYAVMTDLTELKNTINKFFFTPNTDKDESLGN